jgi:hypothetical protein
MNYETFKTIAYSKFQKCKIEDLKKEAVRLMDDFSEGANLTFNVLLSYLEEKMSETEYIKFCEAL